MMRRPSPWQEALRDMADPANWVLALLICVLMLAMSAVKPVDLVEDHSAEWQQSEQLKAEQQAAEEAIKQAQRELRRDMAAATLCREQHGESSFTWTEAGMLVCIPRRGGKVAM